MKTVRRNVVLAAVWVVAAGVLVGSALFSAPSEAQAGLRYDYLHFTAGGCRLGRFEREGFGQGVIDRRNGNTWCVPTGGGEPVFYGTLNLAAIPDRLSPGR